MQSPLRWARLSRLLEIVADVLGVPPASVDRTSGPRHFPQWDSAAHIDIILSLEAEYGVAFSTHEMVGSLSVATLEECLSRKGVDLK
jgi:acyl carrier protein